MLALMVLQLTCRSIWYTFLHLLLVSLGLSGLPTGQSSKKTMGVNTRRKISIHELCLSVSAGELTVADNLLHWHSTPPRKVMLCSLHLQPVQVLKQTEAELCHAPRVCGGCSWKHCQSRLSGILRWWKTLWPCLGFITLHKMGEMGKIHSNS